MNTSRLVYWACGAVIDCATVAFVVLACSAATAKAEPTCVAFCDNTPGQYPFGDSGPSGHTSYPFGDGGPGPQYPFQGEHPDVVFPVMIGPEWWHG